MQLSKGFWQRALSPRQYLAAVILFAGTLFLLKAAASISYPFFGGDAGHRMNNLDDLVVRLGNRRWLPGLQAQVAPPL